jgi:hypothetical protein
LTRASYRGLGARYCSSNHPREDDTVGPEQEPTFGQKAKMYSQAAAAFARNPKALVALVKYQAAERKRKKSQPSQPEVTTPEAGTPEES